MNYEEILRAITSEMPLKKEKVVYGITFLAPPGSGKTTVAKIISEITGEEIKFVSPAVDEFVETMKKAEVPEQAIGMSVGFAQAIKEREFETTNPEISKLLGRKPTSIKDFLKKVYV